MNSDLLAGDTATGGRHDGGGVTAATGGGAGDRRLTGVDVARGVALLGMIAVHALVEARPDGAASSTYLVAGGRAAALFALLAGVGVAFMTGRRRVRAGSGFRGAAAVLATRAAALLAIGLALGWTDPEIASIILPYYAVLFLFAIPLVRLPTPVLAGATVVLAAGTPVVSQLLRPGLAPLRAVNPSFAALWQDPGRLLVELTLTGYYPALTWSTYLCAGIAVGRLSLRSARTSALLLSVGVALAVAAHAASAWLLGPGGGLGRITASLTPDEAASAPTPADVVTVLPEGTTPTGTWWWLAVDAPHSGAPLDLAQTLGAALAVLGAALLLGHLRLPLVRRVTGVVTRPLAAAGGMTLTFYVASVLFMNSALDDFEPVTGYLVQVVVVLLLALGWRRAMGRGPLEAAVSMLAGAARDRACRSAAGRTHRRPLRVDDRVGRAGTRG